MPETRPVRPARRLAVATGLALLSSPLLTALPAQAASPDVVVNEVYGGGGNSGAPYTHDFVELFNGGSKAVDLTGYKLSYYSAGGGLGNSCTLAGTVQAGGYFLVQQAKGTTTNGQALPTPDATQQHDNVARRKEHQHRGNGHRRSRHTEPAQQRQKNSSKAFDKRTQ